MPNLSGFLFEYDPEKKKFVDTKGGWKFSKKRIKECHPVDHCHGTGYIRGILSENINLLENQWGHGTYGSITKPPELTEYRKILQTTIVSERLNSKNENTK